MSSIPAPAPAAPSRASAPSPGNTRPTGPPCRRSAAFPASRKSSSASWPCSAGSVASACCSRAMPSVSGPAQFPRLWTLHTEVCTTFDWETVPELYVSQTPFVNAGAYGIDTPFIVINSSAIELLHDDELRVLLAHEMGHVMSGHALYRTIAAILALISLGALPDARGHRAPAGAPRVSRMVPQVGALRRPGRAPRQPGYRLLPAVVHEVRRRRPRAGVRGPAQRRCLHDAGERVCDDERGPRHRVQAAGDARADAPDEHHPRRASCRAGSPPARTNGSSAASIPIAAPRPVSVR